MVQSYVEACNDLVFVWGVAGLEVVEVVEVLPC
jgi:hypothetical protein